jgi:hypothetical protein
MKIGEALQTQASSLYSGTPIGAPMRPAPIGVADRTRKKIYWRTVLGQHCLLARGTSERQYIGAPRPPCANKLALRCPLRQYIGAPTSPCTNTIGGPNTKNRKKS